MSWTGLNELQFYVGRKGMKKVGSAAHKVKPSKTKRDNSTIFSKKGQNKDGGGEGKTRPPNSKDEVLTVGSHLFWKKPMKDESQLMGGTDHPRSQRFQTKPEGGQPRWSKPDNTIPSNRLQLKKTGIRGGGQQHY